MRVPRVLIVLTVLLTGAAAAQQSAAAAPTRGDTAPAASSPQVTEAYPGLLQRAKVAPALAVQRALNKVRKGQFVSALIEERSQRLVYVIRVDEPSGQPREVLVDADTGRVLSNRRLRR